MKIAFVNQPIDAIIPPNQNSVGACTYWVARPFAKSAEVLVYGVKDTNPGDPAALAAELQLPVVATHPVQFMTPDDFTAHEARVCIAEGNLLANPRRAKHFTQAQYFRTQADMAELFADLPSAFCCKSCTALCASTCL